MSKYSIVVESMDLTTKPATAKAIIQMSNGPREVDMVHFPHKGSMIWKIVTPFGPGAAWPGDTLETGHRMALARFLKKVEFDQSLIGKNSQFAGSTPRSVVSSIQSEELEALRKKSERQDKLIAMLSAQLGITLDDEESEEDSE